MVFEHLQGCCSLMRVTAINLTLQWSRRHQLRVLPELATHINDPDPLVRSAAINATCQMLTALGPALLLQYIPALEEAIYEDPDANVRLAAINATGQLLPALAEAINNDPDPRVRVAAIEAYNRLHIQFDPDLLWQYIAALAEAINEDPDPHVRLAAIKAYEPDLQFQYHSRVLPALAEAINKDLDPRVRVAAIQACYWLPTDLDPDLLWQYIAALAVAINEDPDPHVILAAIKATSQLSTNLDANSQFQYHSHVLPALAAAIYDPNPLVRVAAIKATVRLSNDLDPNLPLSDLYGFYVLPALHGAICDFEYLLVQAGAVQASAVQAMLNISMNYPLDTPRYLLVTVGTLLELRRREDIASDQTSIRAIRNILEAFEEGLPHDTWTSTFNRLRPDQRAECRSILEHDWFEDDSEDYDSFEDDF